MRDRVQTMKDVLACIAFIATGAAAFLVVPLDAQAQSTRAPHILKHDDKLFVAYVNEKSGTATWIVDTDSLDFNLGTPRSYVSEASVITASNAFLDAHKDVFGISREKLKIHTPVETDGTFWFISYTQFKNDMPVIGSEVGITITYEGRIVAAGARAFPDLKDDPLGDNIRSGAPRRRPRLPRPGVVVHERLVIVPEEQADRYTFREAWEIDLENRESAPIFHKTYLIDAQTDAVIAEYDNIVNSFSHGPLHMRLVSEEDSGRSDEPSETVAVPYAHPLAQTLPTNLFATAPPEPVRGQPAFSGPGSLSGTVKLNYYESPDDYNKGKFVRHYGKPFPYAKVTIQNDATQEIQMKYADKDGKYLFQNLADTTHTVTFEIANDKAYISYGFPACEKEQSFSVEINGSTKFNHNWGWGSSGDGGITSHALNSVYHVRAMYDYFKKTYKYDGIDKYTYEINIHIAGNKNVGRILKNTGKMYLGGPNAMSNEIIFHELTHSVIYTLHRFSTGSSEEYRSMDEGFSDYFAADKTNDYAFGGPQKETNNDPLKIVKMLGTSTIRLLYNSCTMDDFDDSKIGNCGTGSYYNHIRGKIISGAIWLIRKDGKEEKAGAKASHLLFAALQMSPKALTFENLRDQYTKADKDNNNSAYAAIIENRFAERRIGGLNIPGVVNINVNTKTKNPVLSWTDNSFIEDGYWVERRYNDAAWSIIDTLAANTEVYTDTTYKCVSNVSNKSKYSYRMVPYKNFGPQGDNPGIGIVRSESAVNILSLSDCRASKTQSLRFANASVAVDMMDRSLIQPQVHKVFTTGLEAPHPNPFNPVTTIRYELADEGPIRLMVYDLLGRRVAVLADGLQESGEHTVRFEASHLSTGLYFVILDAAGQTFTKSILLMK